ncbi:Methyltransferase domain-containing protein [Arboricoccus pini]|uniref:Methyltransferase domain-containing protein n=1 Tax=Arboricoccus pini TaxID=1963835 RepID=A0A212Q5H1_9PROT|nr:class I SAM-dependent methyltransferase [Arboricoccus pini]SNB54524.1 Methyltransferase domain-containing protein [Arboricoccus pini]
MIDYAKERRFASTVDLYRRYRPRYPQAFIGGLVEELALSAADTVMDLGCGPGFLAVAIKPFVGHVIAVDPEPMMIEAARSEAEAAGVTLELVEGGSATLEPGPVLLSAVLMGRSFHWMDREATLARLETMVAPSGAVVLCQSTARGGDWTEAVAAVREAFANDPDHPRKRGQHDHEAVLARSPFSVIAKFAIEDADRVDVEDIVGQALTMSSTSPDRLAERRPAFEAAIRAAVAPFVQDGCLERAHTFEAIIARRP